MIGSKNPNCQSNGISRVTEHSFSVCRIAGELRWKVSALVFSLETAKPGWLANSFRSIGSFTVFSRALTSSPMAARKMFISSSYLFFCLPLLHHITKKMRRERDDVKIAKLAPCSVSQFAIAFLTRAHQCRANWIIAGRKNLTGFVASNGEKRCDEPVLWSLPSHVIFEDPRPHFPFLIWLFRFRFYVRP